MSGGLPLVGKNGKGNHGLLEDILRRIEQVDDVIKKAMA